MVRRPYLAILSDFKVDDIFSEKEDIKIGTPFGPSMSMVLCKLRDTEIVYLQRREVEYETPLRRLNYRANIWGLNKIGVERIISLNYFRALTKKFSIGDLVIPIDLIDFAKDLSQTFYDKLLIIQVDLSKPFCLELRKHFNKSSKSLSKRRWDKEIVSCVGESRFETFAERNMYTKLGCNIVNMDISPEIFLSRELGMCYGSLGIVYSKADDLRGRVDKGPNKIEKTLEILKKILQSMETLSKRKECTCSSSE